VGCQDFWCDPSSLGAGSKKPFVPVTSKAQNIKTSIAETRRRVMMLRCQYSEAARQSLSHITRIIKRGIKQSRTPSSQIRKPRYPYLVYIALREVLSSLTTWRYRSAALRLAAPLVNTYLSNLLWKIGWYF